MFYHYIISSLPSINFGEKTHITLEGFHEVCRQWLSGNAMKELEKITLLPDNDSSMRLIRDWNKWETYIRTCIVRSRVAKYGFEPPENMSAVTGFVPESERIVHEAFSAENPREKERLLDTARWRWLDEAETRYLFKLENLCIYKIRLLINEKWLPRISETGRKNIEQMLSSKS